jgi:hypothetical protein
MSAPPYARAGSQRWLQVAVNRAPELLDQALRRAGAIDDDDSATWGSPLAAKGYEEYRDGAVMRCLGIKELPGRQLSDFWPNRGPVWDALGRSSKGSLILVEAKAHIPEVASPRSMASEHSLKHIERSLEEARKYFAPRAKAEWSGNLYQYANRLAFQYFFSKLNKVPSRLVFLNFCNAADVQGPQSEQEWHGATRLIHALLGLPDDLSKKGVHHAFVDVRPLLVCV